MIDPNEIVITIEPQGLGLVMSAKLVVTHYWMLSNEEIASSRIDLVQTVERILSRAIWDKLYFSILLDLIEIHKVAQTTDHFRAVAMLEKLLDKLAWPLPPETPNQVPPLGNVPGPDNNRLQNND